MAGQDNRVETFKSIGNQLFQDKMYSEALKYYREGLNLSVNHPQLNCNASAAYFKLGLYEEAEEYAVRAIKNKNNYERAYCRAIQAAEARNDFERQLDYLLCGMQSCESNQLLLVEAEKIQEVLVCSSVYGNKQVEGFFAQPRTAHKFVYLENMLNKAKAAERDSQARKASSDAGKRSPGDLFSRNLQMSLSGGSTAVPNNVGRTGEPANSQTAKPGAQSALGTAAKGNDSSKVERGRSPVRNAKRVPAPSPKPAPRPARRRAQRRAPSPAVVPEASKKKPPRDKSNQRTGQRQRTDSVSSNDWGKGSKESGVGEMSINEEIMTYLQKGREAFKNAFYPVAVTFYTKAQTLLKEHSLEDVTEFALCKVPLDYVICEAKVSCGEYEEIEGGIQILKKLVEGEVSRRFPAVLYLLGLAFFKLNRFKEARDQLEGVDSLLKGNINFNTYPWPGTFDVISTTRKDFLETAVKDLLRECSAFHKPNWICIFNECEKISTHIIPSRKIYFNDPDFSGYVELCCSGKCSLIFHRHCWKAYNEQQSIRRLTDKDVLGQPCHTPDCSDTVIIKIKTIGKDGKITHRKSIPYEPPAKKQSQESGKPAESATVPKSGPAFKYTAGKQKTLNSQILLQKSARAVRPPREEVISNNTESGEKEVDFETQLNSLKLKLDNIRNSDKRWQHFSIDAPVTGVFELTEEEKFVESFFEEVLKETGPIHICQVDDYYRDNKVLLEDAVPSLRYFHNLFLLLLERSHRFVLIDTVFGLAADVADIYNTTKDSINSRLKLPFKKDSLDMTSFKRLVSPAESHAELKPAMNTDSFVCIPYKKPIADPEPIRSRPNVPTRYKSKSPSIEIDHKLPSDVPLQFNVPVSVNDLRSTIVGKQTSGPLSAFSSTLSQKSTQNDPRATVCIIQNPELCSTMFGKSSSPINESELPLPDDVAITEAPYSFDPESDLYVWEEDKWNSFSPGEPSKEEKNAAAPNLPEIDQLGKSSKGEEKATVGNAHSAATSPPGTDRLLNGVSKSEEPEEPVLKSVQSFIQAAFQNSLRQSFSISTDALDLTSFSSCGAGDCTENTCSNSLKSIPDSALVSDTESADACILEPMPAVTIHSTDSSPETKTKETSSRCSSSEDSLLANENLGPGDWVKCDSDSSILYSVEDFVHNTSTETTSREEPKTTNSNEDSETGGEGAAQEDEEPPQPAVISNEMEGQDAEGSLTCLPEDVLFLDIPSLPAVDSKSDKASANVPRPPTSPAFELSSRPAKVSTEPTTIGLLTHDTSNTLFQGFPEDLFVIDDSDRSLIDGILLDLPLIENVEWNIEDLPECGDLFAIKPPREICWQVEDPPEFSSGFGPFEATREDSDGQKPVPTSPSVLFPSFDLTKKVVGLRVEDKKNSNCWQPKLEQMDFIRLSFPRENYSRLIEGLGILYSRKGPEIDKMDSGEIVKELREIFQLKPYHECSTDGDEPTATIELHTQSSDSLLDEEALAREKYPWKPPIRLVQVVRLSFPTEEFYKLMFALYLAKLYSNTTRFEDLCDSVANVLNDINEGKCPDYNYEISTHGPYNDESRTIYEKAWHLLINSRQETKPGV